MRSEGSLNDWPAFAIPARTRIEHPCRGVRVWASILRPRRNDPVARQSLRNERFRRETLSYPRRVLLERELTELAHAVDVLETPPAPRWMDMCFGVALIAPMYLLIFAETLGVMP